MKLRYWVVSDPPHEDVDLPKAAALLGLTIAEMTMKVGFRAPEVWLAFGDEPSADSAVDALGSVGLACQAVDAQRLADVPGPAAVEKFSFEDDGLAVRLGDETIDLPYGTSVTAVFCRPPADFPGAGRIEPNAADEARKHSATLFHSAITGYGSSEAMHRTQEALEKATTLDLYFEMDGALRRLSIAQGVSDFQGLGDRMQLRGRDNMTECLDACREHFKDLSLDDRLDNVRPRRRLSVGGAQEHDGRKLYGFGTFGLNQLLASISEELVQLTQFELGSRLSYLMARKESTTLIPQD